MKRFLLLFCLVSFCSMVYGQQLTNDELTKLSKKKKFKTEELQSIQDDDLLKLANLFPYKNWKPIVQVYDELVSRHPKDHRYYYYRGSAYMMGEKYKEAEKDCITAHQLFTLDENAELPVAYRNPAAVNITKEQYLEGLNLMIDACDKVMNIKAQMWKEIGEAILIGTSEIATNVQNITNSSNDAPATGTEIDGSQDQQGSPKKSGKTWVSCNTCNGTGVCRNCNGSGKYSYTKDGKCHECRPVGSGKCGTCKGKKGSYV